MQHTCSEAATDDEITPYKPPPPAPSSSVDHGWSPQDVVNRFLSDEQLALKLQREWDLEQQQQLLTNDGNTKSAGDPDDDEILAQFLAMEQDQDQQSLFKSFRKNKYRNSLRANLAGASSPGGSRPSTRLLKELEELHNGIRSDDDSVNLDSPTRTRTGKIIKAFYVKNNHNQDTDQHDHQLKLKRTTKLRKENLRELTPQMRTERLEQLMAQTDACLHEINVLMSKSANSAATAQNESGTFDAHTITPQVELSHQQQHQQGQQQQQRQKQQQQQQQQLFIPFKDNFTLKPHQIQAVHWILSLINRGLGGILADEMGLGKTITTLAAIYTMLFHQKIQSFRHKGHSTINDNDTGIGSRTPAESTTNTHADASTKDPHLAPIIIIIAPLSVVPQWKDEIRRRFKDPTLKFHVHLGNQQERFDNLQSALDSSQMPTFNVFVTSYELALRDICTDSDVTFSSLPATHFKALKWLQKQHWSLLVVDEGHRLKNSESKLFKAVSKSICATSRLLLTGTPIQNNLKELWSLLNFVLPNIFMAFEHFQKWFAAPFDKASVPGKFLLTIEEEKQIIQRLHRILEPFLLRRTKQDVYGTKLVKKQERLVPCPLSDFQKTLSAFYQNIAKDDAAALSNVLMPMRQIAIHPWLVSSALFHDYYLDDLDLLSRTSGKFAFLRSVLPALLGAKHKLLIFSQFTGTLDLVESLLELMNIAWLRIDGSVASRDRIKAINRFNAVTPRGDDGSGVDNSGDDDMDLDEDTGGYKSSEEGSEEDESASSEMIDVMLISTKAGGLGLNLQVADTVIFMDSDWNPHSDLQAQARAHRIGQTREVLVFRLLSVDSIDEYLYAKASCKLDFENKAIVAGKFDRQATAKEREELLNAILNMDTGSMNVEANKVKLELTRCWYTDAESLIATVSRNEKDEALIRNRFNQNDVTKLVEGANSWMPKWLSHSKSVKGTLRALVCKDPVKADEIYRRVEAEENAVLNPDEFRTLRSKRTPMAERFTSSRGSSSELAEESDSIVTKRENKRRRSHICKSETGKAQEDRDSTQRKKVGRRSEISGKKKKRGAIKRSANHVRQNGGDETDPNEFVESEYMAEIIESSLGELLSMGFADVTKCKQALDQTNGDVERAIELLL